MSCQNSRSAVRAPSGPPCMRPWTSAAAFMVPAGVALTPSTASRPSSSNRSSMPHANAPCAPPPCKACAIGFCPPFAGLVSRFAAMLHLLVLGPAAVHRERRRRHRCRAVGTQEHREGCKLLDGHELLARLVDEHHVAHYVLRRYAVRLRLIGDLLFDQRCFHIAWANRVARYAVVGDFERDRLR